MEQDKLFYANLDYQREERRGVPEVIYGEAKSAEQIAAIMQRLIAASDKPVLATRCSEDKYQAVKAAGLDVTYHKEARIISHGRPQEQKGCILVVCAGTSDLAVAEEAVVTAQLLGNKVERLYDVGVAGLQRLLAAEEQLRAARVLIVVAGMEGALPSVVAGMVAAPVIAVPTSVGYGTALGGLTALFSMLSSCSAGISVVNIDNGFGAAYSASMINQM